MRGEVDSEPDEGEHELRTGSSRARRASIQKLELEDLVAERLAGISFDPIADPATDSQAF